MTAPAGRVRLTCNNATAIVFSDAHYWPGDPSPAHKALVRAIKLLRPSLLIANGDVLDGASISRHDPNGWEDRPTVAQELKACKMRMAELERAAGNAKLVRTIGNHDIRFDRFLAKAAGQFEGVSGFRLAEHLSKWQECWSVWINQKAVVKHRVHNGVHASYNNVVKSGLSVITGHLHRLLVTPYSDYTGRRWGVDTGTLADIDGPQFAYAEDNARPWTSGFAVLTFHRGKLLPPELVELLDGTPYFRGRTL